MSIKHSLIKKIFIVSLFLSLKLSNFDSIENHFFAVTIMTKSNKVSKGWTGAGNYDEVINPLDISEDGLHIDLNKKGSFE